MVNAGPPSITTYSICKTGGGLVCRSEVAEWMFSGGNSMTWLVGHKLVTITTAGCAVNSLKQGMCDRYGAPRRQF